MQIHRNSKYKSIVQFNDIDFWTDFVVITWVNWSGKSQLLEAIKNKNVSIVWCDNKQIIYFDYKTFSLDNESEFQYQHIMDWKNQARTIANQQVNNIVSWKNSYFPDDSYEVIKNIALVNNKPLFSLTLEDFLWDASLYNSLQSFINSFNSTYKNPDNPQNDIIKNIMNWQVSLPYLISDLNEINFKEKYPAFEDKNWFLPKSIGKYMIAYAEKRFDNLAKKTENNEYWTTHNVMSIEQFEQVNWPKPWNLINEVLDSFGNLERRVYFDEAKVNYTNQFWYKLELQNRNPQIQEKISFNDLSSWEKILMSLVSCIYKSTLNWSFPDILLLDEIDASLHPGMIKNLFDVIKDIFIAKYWMKVMVVTHSPTSIAIVDEASLFCMNKINWSIQRIEKIDQNSALQLLSEWYLAFPKHIQKVDILDEKIKLYVEWITDKKYIEKAIALEIEGYDIMLDIEIVDWGGQTRLKQQYQTLKWVLDIVSFHSSFRRIYLFDCDTWQTNIDSNWIIFKRKLEQTADCKVLKWIENLFPNRLLDAAKIANIWFFEITAEHVVTTSWSEQTIPEIFNVQDNQKVNLCEWICTNGNMDDFLGFRQVFTIIRAILSPTT